MIRVAIKNLVPGDEILDLAGSGIVETVTELRRPDGRPVDAIRIDMTNGLVLAGPSAWEVLARREVTQ